MITDKELRRVYHLKNLVRYNTRNKIKNESVAEHSFFVVLFALNICEELNVSDEITRLCLTKALLHDLPEADLNDITYDVKEKLNLRPLLKKYEDEYFKQYYPKYNSLMVDEENTLVNLIVDLADVYSVRQYCISEIELGNNTSDIIEIKQNADNRIEICKERIKEYAKK